MLFSIMAILAVSPSASVALVVTRSATLGMANGVAVAIGVVLGYLVFILFFLVELLTSKSKSAITIDTKAINKSSLMASSLAGFFLY